MADPIRRLVQHLSRLPGIGEKTATRLAFHLIRAPASQVRELAEAIVEVIEKIKLCTLCMNVTEDDRCALCADTRRESATICVVSSPSDVVAIERGGIYNGRYHVLHGLLSPLDGIGPEDLRIDELLRRLAPTVQACGTAADDQIIGRADEAITGPRAEQTEQVSEVIIATAASVEGEATAMYLARLIKSLDIRVSRIASGIPVGGEIEYTDQATIAKALEGRSEL
ncbi:MAG: recombination protein RecR [Proteobacteria bacterium]|nr:recombination protein RecR [Pseudomonadota bacterium]